MKKQNIPTPEATPVKREGEEDMPDYWKHSFEEWLKITLDLRLTKIRIIELIIDHVDFYIKNAATPSKHSNEAGERKIK